MKKTRLLFISALIITVICLLAVGCSNEDKLSSISIKDLTTDAALEVPMGNFDFGAYTLVVKCDSGKEEELPLTEDMILEADLFKFYQEGEHEITVSHGGKECKFKISVKRESFGEIYFPENNVFVYDGNPHTVELEGDIPVNATVTYPSGNSFVNAGKYDVTAVISCDGFVTKKLSTTVTVSRASYDMSGVTFEGKEVVYDGSLHSVEISGTLPEGVAEPKYYINGKEVSGASDAGEYTVVAVFANSDPNYETIPDMETTLKILPAEYEMPDVDIVFENEDGTVIEGLWKTYDALSVIFDINDRSLLSKKISVSFSVSAEDGTLISTSNTETMMINVGTYTVKAEFKLSDGKNYKEIEPVVREFEISKAEYDLSGIHFDSDIVEYNGEEHRLAVELPQGHDIKASNVKLEYYLDGVLREDAENGVCDAGRYTVKAIFTVENENYEPIPDMEATLLIEPKEIDVSSLMFDGETTLSYNGESQTVKLHGLPVEHLTATTAIYRLEGATQTAVTEAREVGRYRCVITVSVDSPNYALSGGDGTRNYTCDFEIVD